MKKNTSFQQIGNDLNGTCEILSKVEQNQVKGGVLLYCEEKRRTINGKVYTTQQWKIANNGSLWLTIKM